MSNLISGRSSFRPGYVNEGVVFAQKKSFSTATVADFLFSSLPEAQYEWLQLRFTFSFATVSTVAAGSFGLYVSTNGATFSTANLYSSISDAWYSSSTIGRITNSINSAGGFVLDGAATKHFQSATAGVQRGVSITVDVFRGNATENCTVTWEGVGQGTATAFPVVAIAGRGNLGIAGPVHGLRFEEANGFTFSGDGQLWAYKTGSPRV